MAVEYDEVFHPVCIAVSRNIYKNSEHIKQRVNKCLIFSVYPILLVKTCLHRTNASGITTTVIAQLAAFYGSELKQNIKIKSLIGPRWWWLQHSPPSDHTLPLVTYNYSNDCHDPASSWHMTTRTTYTHMRLPSTSGVHATSAYEIGQLKQYQTV